MSHGGVHVEDNVDAPAVLYPGREVGVINGGGSPQEGAVAGRAAKGLILFLVSLSDDLNNLAVGLVEVRILTVYGSPCVQTVQSFGNADEGVIRSLHIIPLLELDGVLLVHELSVLEQFVPVVLDIVFLLNKCNSVLEHLSRIGMCARLIVDHCQSYGEVRHTDAATLEHGGRLGCIAGHIGRQQCLADDRECVVHCNAGFGCTAGADIGCKTEGFRNIYVVGLDVLVNIADDEFGKRLERNGNKFLEALHEQRRKNLVHGNHDISQRAAAETPVVCENECDLLGQAADDGVHICVSYLQLIAAVALKQAVDEHECSEVRAHPTVFPETLKAGNGS